MNNLPYYGETIAIYRSSLRWQLADLTALLYGLLPLVSASILHVWLWHIGTLLFFVAMLAVVLKRWHEARRRRGRPYLEVSSEGLEFHSHQYVIRTPWDNLKRVTPNYEILLHRPSVTEMHAAVLPQIDSGWRSRIPLEMFHSDYDSPLYRQLRAHVPQVCPWQGADGQT